MKSFIPVILAIFVFLTGCEPEVKRAEEPLAPAPERAVSKTATPTPNPGHITCFQCKGERFLMVRGSSGNPDIRQSCPICSGKGERNIVIQPGKKICPDCRGMGNIMETRRVVSSVGSSGSVGTSGRPRSLNAANDIFGAKVTCNRCIGTGQVFGK
jgi:hypothetical protein